MKVLQINSVCGIRSTGRICTDIADVLRDQGHTCMVAYGRERVPDRYSEIAYRITGKWGNRIDGMKSRILDNAGFNSRRQTKRFVRWMEEFDPDVIHLHNLHGYYLNVELLFQALKKMNKPVVWTLHDCWAFTGHCAHFDREGCGKWRTGCHSCALKKAYPAGLWRDRSKKNYAQKQSCFTGIKDLTIITPSQWLADLVKQSYLKQYDVRVIPNGIDLNVFQPTEGSFREDFGLQNKRIVLGVASAWGKNKGLYDLYQLADLLGEEYRVVIVGLKPEQLTACPDNVTGIERTNNAQQLAHIYTTADVFVNPTYQDTYPTVNLEAQACGTPVLTYRTGGSPESVPAEQVVEKGDVQALCEAVKGLQKGKVLEMDFSAEKAFTQYTELYRQKIHCR